MSKRKGYIAIDREIFDHPLFKKPQRRAFSRLEAWEWLIGRAAWRPQGQRNPHGVVHTERGEVAITIRALARKWNWPTTNAYRFVKRLAKESMVQLALARCGTKTGTEFGTETGYALTIITICNYDKFQHLARARQSEAEQKAEQKAEQATPQLPGILLEFGTQPINQTNHESRKKEVAEGKRNRIKPPHGAKGRGMVWFDHGTSDWEIYAADFRRVRGADKLPEAREGGRGNWFFWLGEEQNRRRRA